MLKIIPGRSSIHVRRICVGGMMSGTVEAARIFIFSQAP